MAYMASCKVCADFEIVAYGLGHVFGYAVYLLKILFSLKLD